MSQDFRGRSGDVLIVDQHLSACLKFNRTNMVAKVKILIYSSSLHIKLIFSHVSRHDFCALGEIFVFQFH